MGIKPGDRLSIYEVLGPLGAGAMGACWIAYAAAALLEGLRRLVGRRSAPPLTRYRIRTATSGPHSTAWPSESVARYSGETQ